MKTTDMPPSAQQTVIERDLEARVADLFRRHPALYAFHMDVRWSRSGSGRQEREALLSDVGAYPALTMEQSGRVCADIGAEMAEYLRCHPGSESACLLRGRTFSRALYPVFAALAA